MYWTVDTPFNKDNRIGILDKIPKCCPWQDCTAQINLSITILKTHVYNCNRHFFYDAVTVMIMKLLIIVALT